MNEAYFDWNATTPLHPSVITAMAEAAPIAWANPASVHAAGRRARSVLEDAREIVAALVGRDARDVCFTSGGTEANNLALSAATALATSRIEHPSVVRLAERLEARGVPVAWIQVPEHGRVEPALAEAALAALPSGATLAVSAVNHETGVIHPLAELSAVATLAGARLHVDAVQAVGRLAPELFQFGDSLAIASHKIRGPKGIGALAFRPGGAPPPLLLGGAQERGLRPGTVDAVAAAGFGRAAELARSGPERYAPLSALRDRLEAALGEQVTRNGASVARAPHVSNFTVPNRRGDELVAALDLEGLRVSSGSACAAGTSEPSPVIEAMAGKARAAGAVRVSLGEETRAEDVERLIQALLRLLARPVAPSSRIA
jgi:cysteine desulfurase